ncbi:MAG: hypothetical protein KF780_00715 [Sphingomonas sp.]|nr:hypothetical protein [Sphingomonas sp.]
MIARSALAAVLVAALASPAIPTTPEAPTEVRIRNIGAMLETVTNPGQGVYIRAYDGRWYYARVREECPRLTASARIGLNASPGGRFDRDSTISADGWRCFVDSVTFSEGPPGRRD